MKLNSTLSRIALWVALLGTLILLPAQFFKLHAQPPSCTQLQAMVKVYTDSMRGNHSGTGSHNVNTRRRLLAMDSIVALCSVPVPPPPVPPANQPPVAAFVYACVAIPGSPTLMHNCTLDASTSSDPDGTIASYAWVWPGKLDRTGVQAQYAGTPGTYPGVTLTVTDDKGATASTAQTVVIGGGGPQPPPPAPTPPPAPPPAPPPSPPPGTGPFPRLGVAEPPRVRVDPSRPAGPFTPVAVTTCAMLSSAMQMVQRGSELVLAKGLDCSQTLTLLAKPGPGWIIIRTEGYVHTLGQRMTPSRAAQLQLATIRAPSTANPAVKADPNATRYRLEGLQFTNGPAVVEMYNLVMLGDFDADADDATMEDLQVVGSYIYATPGARFVGRGVLAHARRSLVEDNWIEGFYNPGTDAQAVSSWNTPGPLRIVNNYLSATGQSWFIGGGDASWGTFGAPADVEIGRNHNVKPAVWCSQPPPPGVLKNADEIKGGARVYVYEEVIDGSCRGGQTGGAIVLKTACRNCSTRDVTLVDILIRNVGEWGSISGPEGVPADSGTRRITIARMVVEGLFNSAPWVGGNRPFRIALGAPPAAGPSVAQIEYTDSRFVDFTGPTPNAFAMIDGPVPGLIFRNVVGKHGTYGFWTATGIGLAGWNAVRVDSTSQWQNVTIIGTSSIAYPAGTTFSASASATAGTDPVTLRAKLASVVQPR